MVWKLWTVNCELVSHRGIGSKELSFCVSDCKLYYSLVSENTLMHQFQIPAVPNTTHTIMPGKLLLRIDIKCLMSTLCFQERGASSVMRAEERLRHALIPKYQHLFTQVSKLQRGVKFLVDLRADAIVSKSGNGDEIYSGIALPESALILRSEELSLRNRSVNKCRKINL